MDAFLLVSSKGVDMPNMQLPSPGLGTWQHHGDSLIECVIEALAIGYQHIDTAQGYRNESEVGDALSQASVDRDTYVLATKCHWEQLSYDEVIENASESLDRLGVDYLDLLYIHWPAYNYDPDETFAALAELVDRGVVHHVGVSNFTIPLLEEAMDASPVPIVANQVETHPYCQQHEMQAFLLEHDMYHVAYSPLARGNVFEIPEIVEIAERRGLTAAEVALAWLFGRENVVPIPMGDRPKFVRENWRASDNELTDEDVALIESIDREEKYVDPDHAPWNGGEGSVTVSGQ